MTNLGRAARELISSLDDSSREQVSDAARAFIELITFADVDDITSMLSEELQKDWMGMPVWARNLSFRLACLQDPNNAELLHEASVDLYSFGPDWDDHAESLAERSRTLKENG
ncbi:hypothetical protein [Nocardia sp. NPDC058480]|uniref:hypothetical protein n=1 Tax=unclassified Nocardia TaxID=2637762 RepID=UPI003666AA0D